MEDILSQISSLQILKDLYGGGSQKHFQTLYLQFQVRMVKEEIRFELVQDVGKNVTVLKSVKFNVSNDWHTVEIDYRKGRLKLTVDHINKHAQMLGEIGNIEFKRECQKLASYFFSRTSTKLLIKKLTEIAYKFLTLLSHFELSLYICM